MTGRDDLSEDGLPGGDAALCAEYVLGLLEPDEALAFERRLIQDADLQAEVAYWSEHFADLTLGLPEVEPAPAVLRRIEIAAYGPTRPPIWRQVLPYVLGAAAAAAIAWVAMVSGVLSPTGALPDLRADLAPLDTATDMRATRIIFDPASATLTADAPPAPGGRIYELWLVPGQGAPVSLGLLGSAPTTLAVPASLLDTLPGATLAISEEAEGGAPFGAPTGPLRAAGRLTAP